VCAAIVRRLDETDVSVFSAASCRIASTGSSGFHKSLIGHIRRRQDQSYVLQLPRRQTGVTASSRILSISASAVRRYWPGLLVIIDDDEDRHPSA
jgi:hypothetical protein